MADKVYQMKLKPDERRMLTEAMKKAFAENKTLKEVILELIEGWMKRK